MILHTSMRAISASVAASVISKLFTQRPKLYATSAAPKAIQ